VIRSSAPVDVSASVSELRLPCRSADRKQFLHTPRRHCCGSNPGHSGLDAASLGDDELISIRQVAPLSNDHWPAMQLVVGIS